MTPSRLLNTAIAPALADLAALGIKDTRQARVFLVAVALQESRILHRRQVTDSGQEDGPAMSFWQFEKGGGCRGVLQHRKASPHMRFMCAAYNVPANENALWEAMRHQDIVAAAAARLLLYSLPSALPATADEGWDQYIKAWRPGQPHRDTWAANWSIAEETVGESHA